MEKLDIKRECCKASSLDTQKGGSNLILEICKKMNATKYLSGCDGKNYLNEKDFVAESIEVIYQNFRHPIYTQLHGEFMPAMSIADIYFNHGPESTAIIKTNMAVQSNC